MSNTHGRVHVPRDPANRPALALPLRAALLATVVTSGIVSGCRTDPPAGATSEPPPATWALGEAAVRIGQLSGDDAYHFVEIGDAARLRDGGLLVADAGAGHVRRYDEDGRFVAELGGPGNGPGEFSRPVQIVVTDTTISIWDEAHWRLERFDLAGAHLGSADLGLADFVEAAVPPLYPRSVRYLGAHGWAIELVSKAVDLKSVGGQATGAAVTAPAAGIARGSADLGETTLLARLAGDEQVMVDAPWGPQGMVPPLGRGPRMASSSVDGRICAGDARGASVTCFDPAGNEHRIEWPDRPSAVRPDDPEIARWRAETRLLYEPKIPRDVVDDLLAQVPVPTERPPYRDLHLGADGSLWVEIGATDGSSHPEYHVFDEMGRRAGVVRPGGARLLEAGPDYLLLERKDELDVSYIELRPLSR